jgi:hypothetical protein
MRITVLTFLGFYINSAIDTGKYDGISVSDVQDQIRAGTIFEFLQRKLGNDIDLSILDGEKKTELLKEWTGLVEAVDERRKMGIEKSGLTLLMAYLLEGIQQRQDSNPKIG